MFEGFADKCIEIIRSFGPFSVIQLDEETRISLKKRITNIYRRLNLKKESKIESLCADKCGHRCLIMALILLKRLYNVGANINKDNIITYLSSCIMLSFKLTEDDTYIIFEDMFMVNNRQLCNNESRVCNFLRFELYISANEYNKMYNKMYRLAI